MSDRMGLMLDAREAAAEDRYGEWITVACRRCEDGEAVLFDRRDRRPWSGAEPCECGAPAEQRHAVDPGWEYAG